MQAAAAYAMDLATRRAARNETEDTDDGKHRGAWREDYEMRVFGGPTEWAGFVTKNLKVIKAEAVYSSVFVYGWKESSN